MHIYIMRHGQSVANAEHIIAGQHESPLSEEGIIEATAAGRHAKDLNIQRIFSSPMGRAYQTAQIVADAIEYPHERIELVEELRERFLGDIETKHYDETPYGNGNTELAEDVPNIEQLDHFAERVHVAIEKIQAAAGDETTLIVCHNGTGRMIRNLLAGGEPYDFYQQARMDNAAISELPVS